MAEELQGLLERIHKEGIQKAENEKKQLISQAEKEAETILKEAKANAKSIVDKAIAKAKIEEDKAKASIKQSARDVIITLKTELINRINICTKNLVSEAMTPDLMTEIIKKMADSFSKSSGKDAELSLIFSSKDLEKMADHLRKNLGDNLKKQPEILKSSDFTGGLQIGFKGNDVFMDFSDESLTELISGYVSPKLAAMLNEK